MPSSLFLPLDRFQPSEILAQYSEWVYFTLILVFFVSVAGITLRKHFDKPYVKPLIISVGLMLGVFRFKQQVVEVFEGWGILGTILLVVMAATIPYGLCRGFGFSNPRAFSLTYILLYVLSWVKFPGFYETLAESNFGLINLILLIVFFVAVVNVFRPGKLFSFSKGDLVSDGPVARKIDREIGVENQEREMVSDGAEKMTTIEFRTVQDFEKALSAAGRCGCSAVSGTERALTHCLFIHLPFHLRLRFLCFLRLRIEEFFGPPSSRTHGSLRPD